MIRTVLVGLVTGSMFSLSALALVLVYRATSVLNFAQGAVGMFGTFTFVGAVHAGEPAPLALLAGLVVAGSLGLGLAFATGRLGDKRLAATVFTLGALGFLQASGQVIFGGHPVGIRGLFPLGSVRVLDAYIGSDEVLAAALALVLCAFVAVATARTQVGLLARAVAARPQVAASLGVDERPVVAGSWVISSVLATIAGILLLTVQPSPDISSLTLLVVQSFAAALVGRLISLPGAIAGGLLMGLVGEATLESTGTAGSAEAAMFIVMIALLVAWPPRPVRGLALQEAL